MRLLSRSGAINQIFSRSLLIKRRRSYSVSRGALAASAWDEGQLFDDLPDHDSSLKCIYPPVNSLCALPQGSRLYPFAVKLFHTLNWDIVRAVRFTEAVHRYGLQHSIEVFRIIVHVFALVGMQREAQSLLKDVVRYYKRADFDIKSLFQVLLDSPSNLKIARFSVNILVKVLAELSLLEHALDVFVQANRTGLVLDVLPCNFLLKCMAEAGQENLLEALFEEMKRSGPSPNCFTYTIVMNFYSKSQSKGRQIDMGKTSEIFDDMMMSGESPSVVTYAVYIDCLCRSGLIEKAIGFIRKLKNEDAPLNAYCFNAVLRGFCENCKVEEATNIFNEMKCFGISPDTYSYSILIGGLCRQDRLQEALSFMEEMERKNMELPLVCYTSLINGFCKIGMIGAALDLFHRCLQDHGCKCDWVICDVLIKGVCSLGEADTALELFQEMIDNNVIPKVWSFNHLIYHFIEKGLLEMASRCSIIMLESGGVHPTSSTCNAIIDGYCKSGKLVEALNYMQKVQNHGVVLDVYHYNAFINGLCKKGYPEQAWEILTVMVKTSCVPNVATYSIIFDGYARHFGIKKALMLHARSFKPGVKPDVVFYTMLINIFSSTGRMQEAYNFFKRIIRKGLHPDSITYTSIIAGFCSVRDMPKAMSFYKDMLERGTMPNVVTYTCLIKGFCQLNRMDMASRLHEEMKIRKVTPDLRTYTVLISAHRRLGREDVVNDLLHEMGINGVYPDEVLRRILGLGASVTDNG